MISHQTGALMRPQELEPRIGVKAWHKQEVLDTVLKEVSIKLKP